MEKFTTQNNRFIHLYNDDCLNTMDQLIAANSKVDLILTDLPYGTTDSLWDKALPFPELWARYEQLITDTGSIVLFANGAFTLQLMMSKPELYKYKYCWIKRNITNFPNAHNKPLTKCEDILVFSKAPIVHKSRLGERRMVYNPQGLIKIDKQVKPGLRKKATVITVNQNPKPYIQEFTNYPSDVLMDFPELPPNKKIHTNEKPVSLLEFLIKTYTNEGATVLDNTAGSFSTGEAAINTDRNFIGIELNQEYFQLGKDRIEKLLNC